MPTDSEADGIEAAEPTTETGEATTTEASETTTAQDDPTTFAFVCVQNAGRSQMATAFAEAERDRRDLGDDVEIVTGGTQPAERVHDTVVAAMDEAGIDVSDREPRAVTTEELRDADYVLTMGCDAEDVCPAAFGGESRDWGLDDPDDAGLEGTRAIRDEIQRRVGALFDELEYGDRA